jgi:DNA polymerase-2
MVRGFILQPTYRVEAGRPVVNLFGKLEDGRPFLVRDTRQIPHFYVRVRDAERARAAGGAVRDDYPNRHTFQGDPVVRVEVRTPADAPIVRANLAAVGIATFEADVRFAMRYLIDRNLRGAIAIDGEPRAQGGDLTIFDNPELHPASFAPALSVLSIDIETDPRGQKLFSIALADDRLTEVMLLTPPGVSCPRGATPFGSERDLLHAFCERVRTIDPDVVTGWNVVDFDLTVLARIAERVSVPLILGRTMEPFRLRRAQFARNAREAMLSGRVVLDGIDLLRGAFVRFESYALDAVAREVLGEQKLLTGSDRAGEIQRLFREDREAFVAYNQHDAELVLRILAKLRLVELAAERSRLTGMPLDRVAASIASFDFVYLSETHARSIVAPTVDGSSSGLWEATSGGAVLDPIPGLYRNVLVFDFKSLYPSVIRTFQIDPVGWVPDPGDTHDLIVAPNGAAFRREKAILPSILDELFARREEAKRAGNEIASQAIKILMNSFYGVLGTPACRFASPALANAITGFGRHILTWSKREVEARGLRVLYGDTDSLFVEAGVEDREVALAMAERLVRDLNRKLARHVAERWGVESRLELEFDTLYLRLLLPALRHSTSGARKRYAGLADEQGHPRVVFTGMEVVRSDWTELAKRAQRELYTRLFTDEPVEEFLRDLVEDVRAGRVDDQLVYKKSLRKNLAEYTASTPPHVAAARKRSRAPSRGVVHYVMTVNGPEAHEERTSPLDYEHYVQRQVRAVAEPVLVLLGLDFDRVVGDDAQLTLF